MRRPFALIGFTFLAVLVAAPYGGFGVSTALAVLCALFALITQFILPKKWRLPAATILFTAAAAFCAFSYFEACRYAPAAALDGKTAEISGVIADAPVESYGNTLYTIKADSIVIDGKKSAVTTKIRLLTPDALDASPFDRVTAKVKLSLPPDRNTYGYDSRAYYKSKGVFLFASASGTVSVEPTAKKPPYYYAILLRQGISKAIGRFVGGAQGSLAAGILIGDTSGLSDTVTNDFRTCGISHILAVSGTQTSLIMQYLMLFFCALRLPRRASAGITAGAVVVFMAVTGFSPSVMRAGIMSVVCLLAIIIRRDADVINSLGFSAFVLCAYNPYAATDTGLLLSLFATLGMATVSKPLHAFLKEKTARLPAPLARAAAAPLALLCETTGASLLTYPVIVVVFGQISLISLAANMIEVPVSLFVTLATALLAVLSPAPFLLFLIKPLAILIRFGCAFMIVCAHFFAGLPFASISASYGFVSFLIVFAVLLLVLYAAFRKKGAQAGVCVTCLCFAVSVGVFSHVVASRGVMTVAEISDSGGAVVLGGGHAVVIDLPPDSAHPEIAVENYLKANNVTAIDAVVLTAYDKKRAQALDALRADMPVGGVYMPQNADAAIDTGGPEPQRISVPSQIGLPAGFSVTLLPDKAQSGLLAVAVCAKSRAVLTGGGDCGDYSDYNADFLRAGLLVFGGGVTPQLIGTVRPDCAAGPSDTAADTLAGLLSNGTVIETRAASYLTRGGGSYKMLIQS